MLREVGVREGRNVRRGVVDTRLLKPLLSGEVSMAARLAVNEKDLDRNQASERIVRPD